MTCHLCDDTGVKVVGWDADAYENIEATPCECGRFAPGVLAPEPVASADLDLLLAGHWPCVDDDPLGRCLGCDLAFFARDNTDLHPDEFKAVAASLLASNTEVTL